MTGRQGWNRKTDDQRWDDARTNYIVADSGCWEWQGYVVPHGYGQVGRNIRAHRLFYERMVGPVPAGLQFDHTCHTEDRSCRGGACRHRRCVNPAHIEPVPVRLNLLRGRGFAAVNAMKTHCANGHPLTAGNIYWRPDRLGRMCRICRSDAAYRHDVAHRGERAAYCRVWRARVKAGEHVPTPRSDLTRARKAQERVA